MSLVGPLCPGVLRHVLNNVPITVCRMSDSNQPYAFDAVAHMQLPEMLSVLTAVGSAECWHKKSTFKASMQRRLDCCCFRAAAVACTSMQEYRPISFITPKQHGLDSLC
jgi:hypothetical protein